MRVVYYFFVCLFLASNNRAIDGQVSIDKKKKKMIKNIVCKKGGKMNVVMKKKETLEIGSQQNANEISYI